MARSTKGFLSSLAVLAAASTAQAQEGAAVDLLRTAHRTAATVSHCQSTAQDLVGDVALRVWSRHQEVLRGGEFTRYVETSVRNAHRDLVRRKGRSRAFSDFPRDEIEIALEPEVPPGENVPSHVAAEEFRSSLSADDRDVLDQLEAGHSDRQIAHLFGKTRHWVRTAVRRIRESARVYFGDEVPGPLPGDPD